MRIPLAFVKLGGEGIGVRNRIAIQDATSMDNARMALVSAFPVGTDSIALWRVVLKAARIMVVAGRTLR